jgi:hypothetical protein
MEHESYSEVNMIDALFGSKTRVKLLHLFLNNPGKAFYVREITRLIDEQINSVRRELSNMLNIGIIKSDSADNKLYYEINQRYEYYIPFRAIFADEPVELASSTVVGHHGDEIPQWQIDLQNISGLRVAIAAGVLVQGSSSTIDLLLAGNVSTTKLNKLIKQIEKIECRDLNYSILSYDEFYYRLSVHDRFITEILHYKYRILVDKDGVLAKKEQISQE